MVGLHIFIETNAHKNTNKLIILTEQYCLIKVTLIFHYCRFVIMPVVSGIIALCFF